MKFESLKPESLKPEPLKPEQLASEQSSSLPYGWMGSIAEFLATSRSDWLNLLSRHHQTLYQQQPSSTQKQAWQNCGEILQHQLSDLIQRQPQTQSWTLIFEYELPREGGRRPDLILLAAGQILVVEFKQKASPAQADLDQVAAYARDLAEYHAGSHQQTITPILVPTRRTQTSDRRAAVQILNPADLAPYLSQLQPQPTELNPQTWVQAPYAPLPTVIQAARTLFQQEALPQIKRAQSAGIPDLLAYLYRLVESAQTQHQRHLILITGVPGAGKTLVGLQFVYQHPAVHLHLGQSEEQGEGNSKEDSKEYDKEYSKVDSKEQDEKQIEGLDKRPQKGHTKGQNKGQRERQSKRRTEGQESTQRAVFLSGNGPLITVLQYALKSRVFVQAVRNFYLHHEVRQQTAPAEHLIVFDEAQRAWDAERMAEKYGIDSAAAGAILRIAERVEDWCMVVGLIGEGQEIHVGEEEGLEQWNHGLERITAPWQVHCAPAQAALFTAVPVDRLHPHARFNLTTSLRSHLASQVQTWVAHLLSGELESAAQLMPTLQQAGFDAYLTQDLCLAKTYCRERYFDQPDKRYGLLASSRARNLVSAGIANDYYATARLNVGAWYIDPPDSPLSCCALHRAVTEFGCQGLELDFPIIGWGDDLRWDDWVWTSSTRQRHVKNPLRLRLNSYRVLLTRGRDGLIVFVPPDPKMNHTFEALKTAGLRLLMQP